MRWIAIVLGMTMAGFVAATAPPFNSGGAQTSTQAKKFFFLNDTGSTQTDIWINFNGADNNGGFSPANSTAGWACPGDTLNTADCHKGGGIGDQSTLTLAFLHGCDTQLRLASWGWGVRGGDPDGNSPAEEDGPCLLSVGGIAREPGAGALRSTRPLGGHATAYALVGAALTAIAALGVGGAWHMRRKRSN